MIGLSIRSGPQNKSPTTPHPPSTNNAFLFVHLNSVRFVCLTVYPCLCREGWGWGWGGERRRRRKRRRRQRDLRLNGAVGYMHCLTTMLVDHYFPPLCFTPSTTITIIFVVVCCCFFFTFIMLLLYITIAMLVLLTAAEVRVMTTTILLIVNVTNH